MAELADFVEQGGVRVKAILVGGLLVAQWTAPALIGRAPPLSRLGLEDRCRALDKLEHSSFGLPLLAVKAILCILYYEHPDVLRESGIITQEEEQPACLQ